MCGRPTYVQTHILYATPFHRLLPVAILELERTQSWGMASITVKFAKVIDPSGQPPVRPYDPGDLNDLPVEESIAILRNAVELTDDGHPSKPRYLNEISLKQMERYNRLGELADIENC
jgi:hypothetical protein